MEFHERRVVRGIEILDASGSDVACTLVRRTEVQFYAVENRLVIFQVCGKQIFIGLLCDFRHDFGSDCTWVAAHIVISLKVRSRCEHERCAVCSFDIDVAVHDTDFTAVRKHVQAILELDGVDGDIVDKRVAARRHAVRAVRSRHRCTKVYGTILVRRQVNDNHMIRVACEILTRMLDTAMRVSCLCDSSFKV